MSLQYKRTYELTIITPSGETRIIRNLRIAFEITKSLISYPNLARISIYNANRDTLSAIEEKYSRVVLNAGYEGNQRLLFSGEIKNVFQEGARPTKVSTLYAGDGQRDWEKSFFNKTFNANISMGEVIREIISSFGGLTSGTLEGLPDSPDKIFGQTLSGKSADLMNKFADEYNFTWSIQDGQIVTTPVANPITGTEAVLITPATGMIGSPTLTEANVGVGGVEVTTLLNPRLLPNVPFRINSEAQQVAIGNIFFRDIPDTKADGLYKCQEVTFTGDSWLGDWVSTAKGRTIGD